MKEAQWRKDKDIKTIDRYFLLLDKREKGFLCLDIHYDAYGSRTIYLVLMPLEWLDKGTNEIPREVALKELGVDESFIIAYIFEEL